MQDVNKTKEQLLIELASSRRQLLQSKAGRRQAEETLQEWKAKLEISHSELETFVRKLAQDLRGGLGLIVSFVLVLEEYHPTLTDEELSRYLRIIARKGHKVIGVIDQLLETQIGPPQDIETEIAPLDMARIVAQALDVVSYLVEEYQAQIVLPPQESWPVALGSGPWVEEVWVNYISNAIQHGGRPPRVEVGATEQADGTARFWVRDNGPGLTLEEQMHLFMRSPQRAPDQPPGMGLGLVIVRRIMEKLGGQFGVESEGIPGQGSLFYFTLPLAE